MGLNIKNERTVRLVRDLAEVTGQSQTGAIEDAVRRRLDDLAADGTPSHRMEDRTRRIAHLLAEVRDTVEGAEVAGTWREFEADELYDRQGLPR